MFDKENFAELIRFHRFSFDMVGMEENLNISLSLGDWVGNASKRVGVPSGWSFQVDGVSKWVRVPSVCFSSGFQVCVLAQGSKWVRGPSVCFSSGVQVGEGSKCVFWLRGPSGWGFQVCVWSEGSKCVPVPSQSGVQVSVRLNISYFFGILFTISKLVFKMEKTP